MIKYKYNPEICQQKIPSGRFREFLENRRNAILHSRNKHGEKGVSLSRIEIYPSGANKIIGMPYELPENDLSKRVEGDITGFSYHARRRYWKYCNLLQLDDFSVLLMTVTIQSDVGKKMRKVHLVKAMNLFFKRLIREGFDYVYKLEYTRDEIPHLHLIAYTERPIHWADEDERITEARRLGVLWTDCVTRYLDFKLDIFNSNLWNTRFKDMENNSIRKLAHPENLAGAITYASAYGAKYNKEYQNITPERFKGTRYWSYGRENYGDIRGEVETIKITRKQFDHIFLLVKEKMRKAGKKLYKSNSLFYSDIISLLNEMDFAGVLGEEEFWQLYEANTCGVISP